MNKIYQKIYPDLKIFFSDITKKLNIKEFSYF